MSLMTVSLFGQRCIRAATDHNSPAFCDMNVTFTVYMGKAGPQSPVLELMLTVSEGEGRSRSSPFVLQPPTLDEVIISVLLQG